MNISDKNEEGCVTRKPSRKIDVPKYPIYWPHEQRLMYNKHMYI